ncbi:MAG: TolC family protein [Bacteroidetes bacterium]|nr:TolC family protein [Bacteroidota bacterium]
MKKLLLILFLSILLNPTGYAQDKWDLRKCVEYAMANNISIKQADVQARLSELTMKQSKLSQIPTLSFSTGLGINSGNSLNTTTYTINTNTYAFNSYSVQAGVTVYNGLYLHNLIASNRMAWQASLANSEKTKNDVSLNVANAYLQVLLTKEQSEASQLQLHLSQNQLEITRKQVRAGSLPELNAAELESQVAQDSSTYIGSVGNIQQAILTLKAYMGLDASVPFEVYTPPVDDIPIEKLTDLQPEPVYSLALANQPQQKMDALQIEAARYTEKATKGAMLPQVSLFGNAGSNFVTTPTPTPTVYSLYFPHSIGYVNGTGAQVLNDSISGVRYQDSHTPYFKQLNQYFQQSFGVNVSIPILNNGILRTNHAKSKLNLRNQELQRDQDNLTLKQNIYQAYTAAVTALQKFEANKISVTATQKSYDYAQKRYAVGMLNTIDLLTNQNNFFNARINLLSAQYDYVFKMKVLEFYKGLGIKLTKE